MRRTPRAIALLGAVAIVAVACGPAAPENDPNGNLMIVVRDVPDANGGVYIEGSVRYLRVVGEPAPPLEWVTSLGTTTIKVPPGRYELAAWERVCGGNCDNLEPITNRCSLPVDVPAEGPLKIIVSWTVPKPCVMAAAS